MIVRGLQKPGPLSGLAAPKQPGTCSPQPARPKPSLQPHKGLAQSPSSVRGPSQAAAGRGRRRQGIRLRTESVGSGGPYGIDPGQAVPPTGRMAADGDR